MWRRASPTSGRGLGGSRGGHRPAREARGATRGLRARIEVSPAGALTGVRDNTPRLRANECGHALPRQSASLSWWMRSGEPTGGLARSATSRGACGDLWMRDSRREFLAFYANPRMMGRGGVKLPHLVSIGAEMRSVMRAISPFQLQVVPGATFEVFEKSLREHRPRVVSMTMHGVKNGAMVFENAKGGFDVVAPSRICDAIDRAFGEDGEDGEGDQLELVIVSTCNGRGLANELVRRRPSMAVVFWDSVVEDSLSKHFAVALHVCVSRGLFDKAGVPSRQDAALEEAGAKYGEAARSGASMPRDDRRLRAFAQALRRFSRMTYCDPQRTDGHAASAHPCMGKVVIMFSDGAYRFARGEPNLLRDYDPEGTDDGVGDTAKLAASMGELDLNVTTAGSSASAAVVEAA